MNTNQKPIERVLALTHRSGHSRYKMSAVLVDKKGREIACGWNHLSSVRLRQFHSAHAEWHAISHAKKQRLFGSTIFVAGVGPSGKMITAKPCKKCEALCMKHGIKNIVYSTAEGFRELELRYV